MPHPLIKQLDLQPHPEGGYYRQIYQSQQTLTSPIHGQPRAAITHIYFLLLAGQVSRFHKVVHDEVWNFYAGAPLRLIDLHDGNVNEWQLGPHSGEFSAIIPGGHYQAAESSGDYSLVGCSVAPGFDFSDFSFIEDEELQAQINIALPEYTRFL